MSTTTTTTTIAKSATSSSNSSTKTTTSSSKLSSTPTVVSVGSEAARSLIIGGHNHHSPRGLITVHVRPRLPARPLPALPGKTATTQQDKERAAAAAAASPQRPRSVLFASSVHDNHKDGGPMSVSPGSHRRNVSGNSLSESSADENTSIFRRGRDASSAAGGYGGADIRQRNKPGQSSRTATSRTPGERGEGQERVGWWKSVAEKYGSVELDNKGSVARDHLALERTFLAWLRTSLAFASIGIAITQLFRLNTTTTNRLEPPPNSDPNTIAGIDHGAIRLRHVGKPLGATFLAIAIVVLFVGFHRYFESQHWIIRGKFPASRGSIFLIACIAAVLIIGSLVVVVTVDPGVFEK